MSRLVSALICATLFLFASHMATASPTHVGSTLVLVFGTHTEHDRSVTRSPGFPVPMLTASHSIGRFELTGEAIPPVATFRVDSTHPGLRTVSISYMNFALRYHPTTSTWIGIAQTLYNQQSTYAVSTYGTETDRSRLAGLQYQIGHMLRTTPHSSLEISLAVNPHISANLGQQTAYQFPNGSSFQTRWLVTPEAGTQVEAILSNTIRLHHMHLLYGIRYLNLTMRFPNGILADQNLIAMPFIGISTSS